MPHSGTSNHHRPTSSELSNLFHAACRQEMDSLQKLLALYRPLLMKLAHKRLTGNLATKVAPSDLVQTTVWKATLNFQNEQFDARSNFLAWLITILKNEVTNVRRWYRDAKKRDVSRERPLFAADTRVWLSQLSASLSANDAALTARRESIDELLIALGRLPTHYQLVLRYRYFNKLSFGAIGNKLERTYDAARILHNRALQRLRKELTPVARESSND